MGDRQARPQRRTMTAVKEKKRLIWTIPQRPCDAAPDVLADPGSAKPLAFKAQECNLVERIDGSQARIELQTIDDLDRIAKPDVLGAQVAVPVNDDTIANPLGKQPALKKKKAPLDAINPRYKSRRQAEMRVQQHPPIVQPALTPIAQMDRRRQKYRCCTAVELHEGSHEPVELPRFDAVF